MRVRDTKSSQKIRSNKEERRVLFVNSLTTLGKRFSQILTLIHLKILGRFLNNIRLTSLSGNEMFILIIKKTGLNPLTDLNILIPF